MANRRFGRPARSVRRKTDWQFASAAPGALVSVPTGATRVVTSVGISEGGVPPGTIVRIRGCVHIELAEETAADVLLAYGIGIGLFDDRAFAVSNAAGLPKPLLDADDEKWMWFHCGYLGVGPAITDAVVTDVSVGTGRRIAVDIEVDSKAMRIWDENQTLAWVVQNDNVDGASTELDVAAFGRLLLKLN